MSDVNNTKQNIADKIHQAVSSLLDTETRLNRDLIEARSIAREQKAEIEKLQAQLLVEQDARQHLEQLVGQIGDLIDPK